MAKNTGAASEAIPNEDDRYVPSGVAFYTIEAVQNVRDFYFLLLPRTTMLAFGSAIEPLRIANQLTGKCLYRWHVISESGEPVRCSNGISISVDGPLKQISTSDVLLVCSGLEGFSAANTKSLDALRYHKRRGGIVGGICSGAYSLARAGVLENKSFTLHWENQGAFAEQYPELALSDQLFIVDNNVITCGGGVSAVDLMLALIEEDYGAGLAQKVADMCVLGSQRKREVHQRASISSALNSRNPRLVNAVHIMSENLEDPLSLEDVAYQVGASTRQLERLFKRFLGITPSRYYKDIRLDLGRSLIHETELSVMEIAFACGYASSTQFSKGYKARFGESPHASKTKCIG